MVVEAEESLNHEHREKAREQPQHDRREEMMSEVVSIALGRDRRRLGIDPRFKRVRQQQQRGDAQHDAADEAQRQFHALVG